MLAVRASGLTKSFENLRAVDDVDLRIEEGDIVGLLGPNGAGKTTTIFMLLGITEPDAGDVRLLGRPMPAERTEILEQCNFAATYLGLPYRMTVREILEVTCDLYGAPYRRIDEMSDLFGVRNLLGRMSKDMSSGQRTLVVLARALLSRPRLLILDEPTASLDPAIAHRVREVLRRLHAEDRSTILITSHNMADIERLCSRVAFMANGRVVADDTPGALVTRFGTRDLEETFLSIAASARESDEEAPGVEPEEVSI
jgi:ABC-2 type transport system ATP-binding protein